LHFYDVLVRDDVPFNFSNRPSDMYGVGENQEFLKSYLRFKMALELDCGADG
jgi:hypothetical protein